MNAGSRADTQTQKPKAGASKRAACLSLPVVAIVGRPNVGKSTLFNRIVHTKHAIVDDQPGVTRDRNYKETHWAGKRFLVVDTGGLVPDSRDKIESLVRRQVEIAIEEAALVVLVVDGTAGVMPLDREIASTVRKRVTKHLLIVNKMDSKKAEAQASEFYELGLGDLIKVSAEHGTNITELLDAVAASIPKVDAPEECIPAIAIVGKPNVGKSSLINKLTGSDTVIVHSEPGTTRDSIDTYLETARGAIRLVDTAGLRRKSRTSSDLEKYANLRSIRAVDRSDVVVLMLDAADPIAKQDLTIASYVEKAGKGLVVAWNKWDLRKATEKRAFLAEVTSRFRNAPYLPVAFTSSLTGAGLGGLVETCLRIYSDLETRIPTGALNRNVIQATQRKPEAGRGTGFPKIYYAAQTGTRPPAFTLFVNDPSLFAPTYRRYVERMIRSAHAFEGIPIRIRMRRSK